MEGRGRLVSLVVMLGARPFLLKESVSVGFAFWKSGHGEGTLRHASLCALGRLATT